VKTSVFLILAVLAAIAQSQPASEPHPRRPAFIGGSTPAACWPVPLDSVWDRVPARETGNNQAFGTRSEIAEPISVMSLHAPAPDSFVQSLIAKVSPDSIRARKLRLEDFPPRS